MIPNKASLKRKRFLNSSNHGWWPLYIVAKTITKRRLDSQKVIGTNELAYAIVRLFLVLFQKKIPADNSASLQDVVNFYGNVCGVRLSHPSPEKVIIKYLSIKFSGNENST